MAGHGCGSGLRCEAGSQKCRRLGRAGDPCHLTRPCGSGLSCQPGIQKCYNSPRREGEPCSAGFGCSSGLHCEAGTQVCKRPGGRGDPCHLTRPCGSGLSCQPGVQKCYDIPRKAGQPCVLGHECGKGFYCQSFVQKCMPDTINYNSNSPCGALRVAGIAEDAKRAGIVMTFSAGSAGSAGAFGSFETGLVYGDNGEFGCFATACAGSSTDFSIENFANFGVFNDFEDFEGFSIVTGAGVDTPFAEFGFQTSQVWSAHPPKSAGDFARNQLIGTASGVSYGVGLNPVAVNLAFCYTEVLDDGDPVSGFKSLEPIMKEWSAVNFDPARTPSRIASNGSGRGRSGHMTPPPGMGRPPHSDPRGGPSRQPAGTYAAAPAVAVDPVSDCISKVQGRIAWDYKGSTGWGQTNLQRLCEGTSVASEPGRCFQRVMHGGVNWGGGTSWTWQNALSLCAGTSNADSLVNCFQDRVGRNEPWQSARESCRRSAPTAPPPPRPAPPRPLPSPPPPTQPAGDPVSECISHVQGRIAWDYKGTTSWGAANLNQLCQGTSVGPEPALCFQRVMHGGVNWGGGTQWRWQNALSLCAGTSNAGALVNCFQQRIGRNEQWQSARDNCRRSVTIPPAAQPAPRATSTSQPAPSPKAPPPPPVPTATTPQASPPPPKVAPPPPPPPEEYSCVCTKPQCGGRLATGERGKAVRAAGADSLMQRFGLNGRGRSKTTGWSCMKEKQYSCKCVGNPKKKQCSGAQGKKGAVRKNISAVDAIKKYGALRHGPNSTGWKCN
jgi:hypothetical protein